MNLQAGRRHTVSYWNSMLMMRQERPESIDSWLYRTILVARASDAKPLADLKLVVGTAVYREMLQTMVGVSVSGLTHVYGAELQVDHELAVPFEVRWTSRQEAVIERLKQQYGDVTIQHNQGSPE